MCDVGVMGDGGRTSEVARVVLAGNVIVLCSCSDEATSGSSAVACHLASAESRVRGAAAIGVELQEDRCYQTSECWVRGGCGDAVQRNKITFGSTTIRSSIKDFACIASANQIVVKGP